MYLGNDGDCGGCERRVSTAEENRLARRCEHTAPNTQEFQNEQYRISLRHSTQGEHVRMYRIRFNLLGLPGFCDFHGW